MVRRNRNDSVPVSMMWARFVIRSNRAFTQSGIGKHRGPFGERQVGRYDNRRPLGPLRDHLGVEFFCATAVGADIRLNELDNMHNAEFISIGTWKESWMYLPVTELKGVLPALVFLEAVSKREPAPFGPKVVVIGSGNAAVDSTRTALRKGSAVTVIYRRERKDMPAIKEEADAAEAEGARFVFLATPHRIVPDEHGGVKGVEVMKTRLGEFDSSGRRKPVPTEEIRRHACDTVILAVGETVDPDFARGSGLKIAPSGVIEVDRFTLETSRNKFYAGGDAITGASDVSNALGLGKKAARNIDQRLMGASRFDRIMPKFEYGQTPPEQSSASKRREISARPARAELQRSHVRPGRGGGPERSRPLSALRHKRKSARPPHA